MNFTPIYDPNKAYVYKILTEYFENPLMTKIKDVNDYSMYMTKINAMLGIEYHYIVLFVTKDDKPKGYVENMESLPWITLQTRTLSDNHDIQLHSYIPRRLTELSHKIRLQKYTERGYTYSVDSFPYLTITLLPLSKNKKSGAMDYTSEGSIVTALETYQTIVSFND